VVRVGDTVRRPLRPSSPATQALLEHLERVGFSAGSEGAPTFLGVDEQGREVLSYLPGETVTAPYPAWSMTDAALDSVAHLLRRYHEAVDEGFDAGDPLGRTGAGGVRRSRAWSPTTTRTWTTSSSATASRRLEIFSMPHLEPIARVQ
jgi:hypothetical protein